MKHSKSLLILTSLALASCKHNVVTDDYKTWSIIVPTGAPSLAFYKYADSDLFETNSEAQNIIMSMVRGDKEVTVLPTNVGVQAINARKVPYLLASTITFGNLYVASTGKDKDGEMNDGDYIVLFSEGSVPDKVFHYVYGESLNNSIHYVKDAQVAAGCLKSGINVTDNNADVDYVLIAEPSFSVINAQLTSKREQYADLQELYKLKAGGLDMFQASIFVKNSLNRDEVNKFLGSVEQDILDVLDNPSLFDVLDDLEDIKSVFGVPSSSIVKNVTINGNRMGLGYKNAYENKKSIDNFLGLFGIGETNEEIYFK